MAHYETAVAYAKTEAFNIISLLLNTAVHATTFHQRLSPEEALALSQQVWSLVSSQAVSNPDGIGAKLVDDNKKIRADILIKN